MGVDRNTNKPLVHVVAGPTAAGKTKYAITLAQEINGELINADSRQIYKHLDIGTNKGDTQLVGEIDLDKTTYPVYELENSGINIHLLSFLEPDQQFSALEFQRLAYAAIAEVIAAGKVPILVGGTGFYIDAVLDPQKYSGASVYQRTLIRERLKKAPLDELWAMLPSELLESMNNSDRHNPVRLISRIARREQAEIANVEPTIKQTSVGSHSQYQFEKHYISLPLAELTNRINERVDEMWQQGLPSETQKLLDMGFASDCPALSASGYPQVLKHLKGELSQLQCLKAIKTAHRQVAKKQITWFKKYFET